MDYMVRLLIGAAQIVAADKAEAAERQRVKLSTQAMSDAPGENAALVAEMAEWHGRHAAWLEAAALLERVSQQALSVPA